MATRPSSEPLQSGEQPRTPGDSNLVTADVYNDPAFETTLIAASVNTGGERTMQAYDGQAGAPTIEGLCSGDDGDGRNEVVSTVMKDGRVVRERMECGPDMVVAYDESGTAHRFPDEKVTKLPVDFSVIPDWRLKQVNETAYDLIESRMKGLRPDGGPDGMISFNDIADIMQDISKMDNLTEVEKCRLWSEVRNVLQERDVPILDADEKPEMIDSWKGSGDPWHALITLSDGYHGNRLINMSREEASAAIAEHEDGAEADQMGFFRGLLWRGAHAILGRNEGDVKASEGQLEALRALRSQGTFAAYAAEWRNQFVRTDRDKYGWPR